MASLKLAIREKCKQCTYDPCSPGTYLKQIESCSVRSCPLWLVRPLTSETIHQNRLQRVNIDALVAGLDNEEEEVV